MTVCMCACQVWSEWSAATQTTNKKRKERASVRSVCTYGLQIVGSDEPRAHRQSTAQTCTHIYREGSGERKMNTGQRGGEQRAALTVPAAELDTAATTTTAMVDGACVILYLVGVCLCRCVCVRVKYGASGRLQHRKQNTKMERKGQSAQCVHVLPTDRRQR